MPKQRDIIDNPKIIKKFQIININGNLSTPFPLPVVGYLELSKNDPIIKILMKKIDKLKSYQINEV